MKFTKIAFNGLALVALSACGATATESDFGNSVRNMVQAQQAHPEVSAAPSAEAVDGTDAGRIENVVKTYREGVTSPQQADRPVTVNIGNRN